MAAPDALGSLREAYLAETARIRAEFEKTGDGLIAIQQRSELVDRIVLRCGAELANAQGVAIAAMGGYGRRELFPFSDVDLLFLCASESQKNTYKDAIRRTSQELWDLRLKLSPTTRTLADCDRVDSENIEFTISLMDTRFLAGDQEVFRKFKSDAFPKLLLREWQALVQLLVERTQVRHEKYGHTLFHLEPNIKEAPGGLRDFHVYCWLRTFSELESGVREMDGDDLGAAMKFLADVRTFLHYTNGRDDNTLSWEWQDKAAAKAIGMRSQAAFSATTWMRTYFRHARTIERAAAKMLQEVPAQRSNVYRQFQRWRSRVSNADFSVVEGRVYFQNPLAAKDAETVLRLFEFIATHGFQVSGDAETRIQKALPDIVASLPWREAVGRSLSAILTSPHAAHALRSMHALSVLGQVVPEFQLVDALVIRDFYHRYTVDEHTFTAIDNLHRLPQRENEWEKKLSEILKQVERPEILPLALLMHDLGKGMPGPEHATGSVQLAEAALSRLGIDDRATEDVIFLIAKHLIMSAAMRRDIFDPENVNALAQKVGTLDRLRMLCLLTYADIRAVNPDALTPWKAETLWRLYTAVANQLNRGLDDDRYHATASDEQLKRLEKLIPNRARQLQGFLEGLPRRYLLSHTTDQIAVHFDLSLKLVREPVAVALKLDPEVYELSVVSTDRPFLFSRIAGTLAAWGMNIVKANAFSNAAGQAVDSFYFKDKFRTLELNPPERDRFKRCVADVVIGKADLETLLQRRGSDTGAVKVSVASSINTDQKASSHSTVLEVIAQDRTGLLHTISSAISEQGCNIELALIDTEGQAAIDVFYVTKNGKKLSDSQANAVRKSLIEELS